MEKNIIIDLQNFQLIGSTLYIEGVGIIKGHSAKEYSDINYQLIIKNSSVKYIKNLAKAHRSELTATYSTDENISYDKCWFATSGYRGVDISDIPIGTYELWLKITVNNIEKTIILCSQAVINLNNSFFTFEANHAGNKLIIKKPLKGSTQKFLDNFSSKFGTIKPNNSKLEMFYPNNHSPILAICDVMANIINFKCDDDVILKQLCTFIQANNNQQIIISEEQDLMEVLTSISTKIEEFIIQNTKFSKDKLKVNGYYQDEFNNIIDAPFDLHNVHVQFFGKNNHVIIHKNSNLKNTFIEFKGNNATFTIGEHAGIFGTFRLGYGCNINIGNKTTSTNAVYVTCAENTNITIGDDCMFATNNQIRTDDAHGIYDVNTGKRMNKSKDITIGNHVWIAYSATIFGGSKIGNGSVIGAYSLVKKSIPNNCIAAGIPAKVIKKDIFWERPLLLNEVNEKIFPSEYLQAMDYIQNTEE